MTENCDRTNSLNLIQPELIHDILAGYRLPLMGKHGVSHWGRVLDIGLRLANSTGAQSRIVMLFAIFHDARRETEYSDPGHGRRGADLATILRPKYSPISDREFELLRYACEYHADGLTNADITVQTCWDADRLDLWRVGQSPQSDLLCTQAARDMEIQKWAMGRGLSNHTPAYITEKWLKGLDHPT